MPKSRKKSYARENSRLVKKFKNLSVNDIYGMDLHQSRDMLKKMREQFRRRAATHERAMDKNEFGFKLKEGQKPVYTSNAYNNIKAYYDKNGEPSVENMRIEQVKAELSRLNDFYNAKSSTVTGARQIAQEQDARIFGTDENGKPLYRMSTEQREALWKVYDEAAKSSGMASAIARSYSMEKSGQQLLGEIVRVSSPEDLEFNKLYARFQHAIKQSEAIYGGFKPKDELDPVVKAIMWDGTQEDWDRRNVLDW